MLKLLQFLIVNIILLNFIDLVEAGIADNYCGKKNCYDILGVKQEATLDEIKKAYRSLSRKFHPDKAKQDTTALFQEINQAYEILSKKELRESYDYFVTNPEKGEYYHYYAFYKATYLPQTDPKTVLLIVISLFSFMQYAIRKSMYEKAINYAENTDKFKRMVNEKYQEEKKFKSKEDVRLELRQQIKISGGYSNPKIKDILIFKLILIPWNILNFFIFHIRWTIRYRIKKQEYTKEDEIHITKKLLNVKDLYWDNMTEEQRSDYIDKKLWIPENFIQYQKEMQEIMNARREEFLQSNRGKQYLRYMKNSK